MKINFGCQGASQAICGRSSWSLRPTPLSQRRLLRGQPPDFQRPFSPAGHLRDVVYSLTPALRQAFPSTSKTTRSVMGNRCADEDLPALRAWNLRLDASFSMLGGTHADRSEDEGRNVPAGTHSKRAASDCPCAEPASGARQKIGTSFSSDHLADASSRCDGRLSGQKKERRFIHSPHGPSRDSPVTEGQRLWARVAVPSQPWPPRGSVNRLRPAHSYSGPGASCQPPDRPLTVSLACDLHR